MSWIITGREADPLLLDSYSGAAAAYSLRQLSWAYGGPAVRVRRDSDNAEQDFTATEVSDGTLAAWVGAGNDGFVRTWYDQSGNGQDAVQTTVINQPKIVSNGSVVFENGKPALSFDLDYLECLTFAASQPVSYFFVAKETAASNVPNSFIDATGDRQVVALSTTAGYYVNAGFLISDGVYPSNIQTLYTAIFNSSSSVIGRQGSITSTGNAGSGGISELAIGNNRGGNRSVWLSGPLQELIIYSSDQSSNRTGIETNINAHYSIYP